MTIQLKAIEQYFYVVLFIMLYKLVVTFLSGWNPITSVAIYGLGPGSPIPDPHPHSTLGKNRKSQKEEKLARQEKNIPPPHSLALGLDPTAKANTLGLSSYLEFVVDILFIVEDSK